MKPYKELMLEALNKVAFKGKIVMNGKEFEIVENDPKKESVTLKNLANGRKRTVNRDAFNKIFETGDAE